MGFILFGGYIFVWMYLSPTPKPMPAIATSLTTKCNNKTLDYILDL